MNRSFRIAHRLMVIALLALSACGIFDTRDPEPPSQLRSSFVPPTDAALVFQNLVGAFRDRNALNYVRCLSDSLGGLPAFRFEPEPQARQQYSAVFSTWTRQSEQQYFESMVAQVPAVNVLSLELLTLAPQGIGADSAQYEAQYRLTAAHGRPTVPTVANGRALFYLAIDRSGNWSIVRWVDLAVTPGAFTWSGFKGTFGQ